MTGFLTNRLLTSVGEEREGYPDSELMLPGLEAFSELLKSLKRADQFAEP